MLDSELLLYLSEENSAADTNGGRRGTEAVTSGVVNNVFPHVTKAQRTSGQTLYRKLHLKAANDDDETLLSALIWAERYMDSPDWVVMFLGDADDTQADIDGSERLYGYAYVSSAITAGASTITVTVSDSSIAEEIFQDGDLLRLFDMATPSSSSGNEEFLTVSGTPTVSDTTVTITVSEEIENDYAVFDGDELSGAMVVSYPDIGDVECSTENFTVTSSAGEYDDSTYPVVTDNLGTVEDSVTLTFTDATNYTVTGSSGISYGSGTTTADFAPTNSENSKPYFTIEYDGFSGTFVAGDTITFDIHPADVQFWLKRVVPASCSSLANNKVTFAAAGESVS